MAPLVADRAARGAGPGAAGDRRRRDRARRRRRRPRPGGGGRRRPDRARHGRQGGDRRPSASGCCRTCAARSPSTRSAWPRVTADDELPAPPRRPRGAHPEPDRAAAYALHVEEDEVDDDPAGAAADLAGRRAGRRRPGRGDLVDRRARTAGCGATRAAPPVSASPAPATCAPGITGGLLARGADPAQAARVGGVPARPLRASGWRRRSAGWASWPASSPPRSPGRLAEITDPDGGPGRAADVGLDRWEAGRDATTTSANWTSAPRRSTTRPSSRRPRSWWAR